jgi:hypothetical protein
VSANGPSLDDAAADGSVGRDEGRIIASSNTIVIRVVGMPHATKTTTAAGRRILLFVRAIAGGGRHDGEGRWRYFATT